MSSDKEKAPQGFPETSKYYKAPSSKPLDGPKHNLYGRLTGRLTCLAMMPAAFADKHCMERIIFPFLTFCQPSVDQTRSAINL